MHDSLICPVCRGSDFSIKYEATYVYSYALDEDAPGIRNTTELLPFMFDNREQKEARQFLECNACGSQYPCFYNKSVDWSDIQALQKAIDLYNSTVR